MSRSPSSEPSPDPHVAALRRVLVPLRENPPQVGPERAEQAERLAARARTQMGTGIDPAVVAACADDYDQALKLDPACVPAYQGLVRAALALASTRPEHAKELLAHTLRWLRVAQVRVAPLQDDTTMLELEDRLRAARSRALERPSASGPSVRVQVRRDAEGRTIRPPTARRERPRFRPDSEELRALIPELFVSETEGGPEVPRWAAPTVGLLFLILGVLAGTQGVHATVVGAMLGMSLLLLGLPLLVALGRRTRGWAPSAVAVALIAGVMLATDRVLAPPPLAEQIVRRRFGAEVDQAYVDLQHKLRLPDGLEVRPRSERLQRLALVEETGDPLAPLRTSPLQPRLSEGLRSDPGQRVSYVAVLRRYRSSTGWLLLVWVLAPERGAVVAQTAFSHQPLPALEQQVVTWLEELGRARE